MHDRPGRPRLLAGLLALTTAGIVALLLGSEVSGTGAVNVGDDGRAPIASAVPTPAATSPPSHGETAAAGAEATPAPAPRPRPRRCEPTQSNPGGTNNYIPDAPAVESLGRGFIITGLVRSARGCEPLEDIRIQVWLATETGSEQDNRASVRTGPDGRYRIQTAKTIPQFGEPNIHVGYDDGDYREVFIRRVVDLDDRRAVVDLTLAR